MTLFMMNQKTVSGGKGLNSKSTEKQKKPWLHFCFKYLLVLFLFCLVFCFMDNSMSCWDRFPIHKYYSYFVRTYKSSMLSYKNYPKYKMISHKMYNTTEAPTVLPQYHQAYPRNYHFIMDNKEVCKKQPPFLVLMVPVAPSNIEARDAIRQTWGNESLVQGHLVVTLFILGLSGGDDFQKLNEENLRHHDLIQSDFMDTYLNLTIKTLVIMDWLATHCQNAAFAMKIDSDMFLNIDNLVKMLQKLETPKVNYLTGMLMWNRPVVRSKDSKWYVPKELFPEPTYPTYTLGMGYILSNDLPLKIVEVSKLIKPFNIEDAYVGMCIKKLGLAPTSPPDPSQFKAYNTGYNRCKYSKIITYILSSSQELVNYWKDFKLPGPYC